MRTILAGVIATLMSASTALAQNKEVAPPPQPLDQDASIEDTIKSIQI
jgi:hypothetical protein